ncbi:MAG: M15 family metallopeptidase [Acidobacteriota bacterium]|nr:M15 family metallopeptidase [Acidobacteriota bacterium]
MLNELEITGRSRTHVVQYQQPRFAAQAPAAEAFLAMREAAAKDGIDLKPFSSFRGFKMQLRIWNKKYRGAGVLYDMQGRPRDRTGMTEEQIIGCILNWSALPGGSRHQWGTEIDVIDAAATPPAYKAKLLPEEVAPGGVYHRLHLWLDTHCRNFGFFRPYAVYRGGMYPEPWHLSYAPLSTRVLQQLTPDILRRAIEDARMEGKAYVLQHLERIFEEHVTNITPPDEAMVSPGL